MAARNAPSTLETVYLVRERTINRMVTAIIRKMSVKIFESTVNGWIVAEVPSTKKMLKILLPMIFPNAMSTCFFNAAVMEVTNSGRDVPTATIVKPTKVSLIPSERAIWMLLLTTRLPPKMMPASPPTVNSEFFTQCLFAVPAVGLSVFRRSFRATSKM